MHTQAPTCQISLQKNHINSWCRDCRFYTSNPKLATWTDASLAARLMLSLFQREGLSTLQKDFTLETTACPTRQGSVPFKQIFPTKERYVYLYFQLSWLLSTFPADESFMQFTEKKNWKLKRCKIKDPRRMTDVSPKWVWVKNLISKQISQQAGSIAREAEFFSTANLCGALLLVLLIRYL